MANDFPDFNAQAQWAKVKVGFADGGELFKNMNPVQNHKFVESEQLTSRAGMDMVKAEGGTPHDPWVFRYPSAKL